MPLHNSVKFQESWFMTITKDNGDATKIEMGKASCRIMKLLDSKLIPQSRVIYVCPQKKHRAARSREDREIAYTTSSEKPNLLWLVGRS